MAARSVKPRTRRGPVRSHALGRRLKWRRPGLDKTSLRAAIDYYVANRNCAPASKKTLESTLGVNVADWMGHRILAIDTIMLQERYQAVLDQ